MSKSTYQRESRPIGETIHGYLDTKLVNLIFALCVGRINSNKYQTTIGPICPKEIWGNGKDEDETDVAARDFYIRIVINSIPPMKCAEDYERLGGGAFPLFGCRKGCMGND
jgi:hypothetical protein